jgi:GNAT superfamily N-acetyltransferase
MTPMLVRDAAPSEVAAVAALWRDAWLDAHAALAPPELLALRTPESFRDRIAAAIGDVRTLGPPGAPLGFHWLKDAELHQLFVAAPARGTGVAAALIADAEDRLAARGVGLAWLACMIGNDRAARFYEKCGWRRAGTSVEPVAGGLSLEVWRYEKRLAAARS